MDEKFIMDYEAMYKSPPILLPLLGRMIRHPVLRLMYWGRRSSSKNRVVRIISKFNLSILSQKTGIEIGNFDNVGGGIQFIHPYCITVNGGAVLGQNVVLFKGCTIGSVRSGNNQGAPVIGERVVIGANAMVCGGITIGNDVLIAAYSFVNFSVPSNSVVIGNPGKIHHKENPCRDYCT